MAETTVPVGAELRERLYRSPVPLSARQLRLAACACCHRAWRLLGSEASRRAVRLAERSADGHVGVSRLESAYLAACNAADRQVGPARQAAARLAAAAADPRLLRPGRPQALAAALDRLAGQGPFNEPFRALVRDVLGPPRRTEFRPEWRTPTVVALTRRVLEERDAVALLVLADALEEAGCVDDELLAHCRSGEAHVRGCWALDAITGRG
jgi:hypothetical protein